jgi:membrane-bound serine protease (ClpP class)
MVEVPMPTARLAVCLALAASLLTAPARAAPPLLPPQPVVRKLILSGSVDAGLRERTERHLRQALDGGANVLLFELDCSGGDAGVAHDLARTILGLADRPSRVLTIAYVTPHAQDTASLLALACDSIVLNPAAHLGNWEPYIRTHPDQEGRVRDWLVELAEARGRPGLLARALADHDLHLRLVRSGSEVVFEEGMATGSAEQVKPQSRKDPLAYLTLDAAQASRYGLAEQADNQAALCRWLGVDEGSVVVVHDDFLDRVGAILRNYWTRLALIALGVAALLLEFRFPRATVPGVLATICFVLLFWSHSRLNQQATALALGLFGLGVVLLAVEVSWRPGFRAAGVAGGALLCVSLGLLAYGQWPHGPVGWGEYGFAFSQAVVGILVALGLATLLTRYLPRLPAGWRLLPASGTQPALPPRAIDPAATLVETTYPEGDPSDHAELLGAIGSTATPLRPTGMVRIGDAFVAAVCDEGSILTTGARVQVVDFRDGRIVVQAV